MRIKRGGVIRKNPRALALEVVELAAEQCPAEHRDQAEDDHGGKGDEQVEDVHAQRASRIELVITNSELHAMPRPAAHGGRWPLSASGTQHAL